MEKHSWEANREEGEYWEERFATMMRGLGHLVVRHQEGRNGAATGTFDFGGQTRRILLADVTVWGKNGATHWEIKNKKPTDHGRCFGVEERQLRNLLAIKRLSGEPVYVCIHDHQSAGGKHVLINRMRDWVFAEVGELDTREAWSSHTTLHNGRQVVIYYWPRTDFHPLCQYFFASTRDPGDGAGAASSLWEPPFDKVAA